jgi:hypothetical protein
LKTSITQRISIIVALSVLTVVFIIQGCRDTEKHDKIDRYVLVNRHNIIIERFDSLNSLSIGNGDFTFTTDITGLQTFYNEYSKGVPLGTQSNWGWHVTPNQENFDISESVKIYMVNGRDVPYLHQYSGDSRQARISEYFRANPHRIHLGFIRLIMITKDGASAEIKDIKNLKHSLDLWQGKITSQFEIENEPVKVEVFCHQDMDLVAARITSPLVSRGKLYIQWEFAYPVPVNTSPGYDLSVPERHTSIISEEGRSQSEGDRYHAVIKRTIDSTNYETIIEWTGPADFKKADQHVFRLKPSGDRDTFEFSCLYTPVSIKSDLPDFEQTRESSINGWKNFWESGGAVDFSECSDPRAFEIERRTILSQYLTRIQSAGSLPPSETGLTYNSWYGKFHLEMHWWHSVHFALWGRPEYLVKQMEFYNKILPLAKKTASDQGYSGARWPKMVGPDGRESPSTVGTYLIWQQPHIIYFAELIYRHDPSMATLEKYKDLVFATADFMADFAQFDPVSGKYNLVPPLIPAQEIFSAESTFNPPFELTYWYWGLSTAQKWRERLNIGRDDKWDKVIKNLAEPVMQGDLYLAAGNAYDSYNNTSGMRDHPIVLGSYGILPGWRNTDAAVIHNTLDTIMAHWDWASTWGWDYPLIAICAARLNEPDKALEILLKDVQKNKYLLNGHNYQNERLRIYLPGNGGFLTAIAVMCAGWEGCNTELPGFPKDGKWKVKWEGLSPIF